MRHVLMAVMLFTSLSGCATDTADNNPQTGEREQAVTQLIGEKFENFDPGNIDGKFGWSGNCTVVDGTDKYVKCAGGASASKEIGLHGAGSYKMLVDLGPNINVENSTHGKIFLEGPPTPGNSGGYVFQIIVGCDNIRAAFQQSGPTMQLLSFPCHSVTGPPAIRVICEWQTGGRDLACGAAFKPTDPTPATYQHLALPSGLQAFDSVELVSFNLPGASLFDKIYVWEL